jgi:hypothetical protein
MSVPPVGKVGRARPQVPGRARSWVPGGLSVVRSSRACAVDHVTDGNHEALACGVIATGTGGVGAAEPVVHGVEKPLEHQWVWHAGEVPLRVPMRGGGWQLAGGAVVGLVVGGGDEVPDHQEVVAAKILVCRHVGAGGRGVRYRSVSHPVGEPRLGNSVLLRGCHHHLASGCVAL